MNLEAYGFNTNQSYDGTAARVVAVHKERYKLVSEEGECYGRLKTKEYYVGGEDFPTAGDFVLIKYNPSGDSMIVRTLPRRTYFMRKDPDPNRAEQAVAANFDYVSLVTPVNVSCSLLSYNFTSYKNTSV